MKNFQVSVVTEESPITDDKTLQLHLSIDMLDMGSRSARFWGGFGMGAQMFRIVVSLKSKDGYLWSFKHERHSMSTSSYEKCLTDEMENFCGDVVEVMQGFRSHSVKR